MKYRVKVMVETEKKGFFGGRKKVYEEKWVEVDEKTYRKMQKEKSAEPMSIEEMVLMDWFLD